MQNILCYSCFRSRLLQLLQLHKLLFYSYLVLPSCYFTAVWCCQGVCWNAVTDQIYWVPVVCKPAVSETAVSQPIYLICTLCTATSVTGLQSELLNCMRWRQLTMRHRLRPRRSTLPGTQAWPICRGSARSHGISPGQRHRRKARDCHSMT